MTETLALTINGKTHRDWTSYSVDSDFFTPADAWRVSLGLPLRDGRGDARSGTALDVLSAQPTSAATPSPDIKPWSEVKLTLGDQVILTGRLDRITRPVRKGEQSLSLQGRDHAAMLVDCTPPIFAASQMSLPEVVVNIVRPLGVTKIKISQSPKQSWKKVAIEPGMRAWDALQQAAEAAGLWPWFDPDGTLRIAAPDYTTAPVATLILDRERTNVLSLEVSDDVSKRYSEITVLGQSSGADGDDDYADEDANPALKYTAKDPAAGFHRPLIVRESAMDGAEDAKIKAKKMLNDGLFESQTITARVRGHFIPLPPNVGLVGRPHSGGSQLWSPGQRVRVISVPHGLNAIWFLTARTFARSKTDGTTTDLTLKPDGLWLPDTSTKRKKKKGDDADDE